MAKIIAKWSVHRPGKIDHHCVVSCQGTVLTTCCREFLQGGGYIVPPADEDFLETGLRYYA